MAIFALSTGAGAREEGEGGREKEGKWSIPSSSIVNLEVVGSTRGNQSEKGFMSV